MKKERFATYIRQFPPKYSRVLFAKLAHKKKLEEDSSFKIPARIWFAFLTPPSDQELREVSSSRRFAVTLKKTMLEAFKNPEQFLTEAATAEMSDCVTLCLLEILFDLTERKILLERPQYDQWVDIAEHYGQWRLRYALEDGVFATFDPENFALFESVVASQISTDKKIIAEIHAIVEYTLQTANISGYKILNRRKNIYGVYLKVTTKGICVNNIFDIHGFRILVRTEDDCYRAFDAINALWPHFRERYKDYIARPKKNGYQSIHTVFSSINRRSVEFQIRTYDMDRVAESGPANHAAYKRVAWDTKRSTRV